MEAYRFAREGAFEQTRDALERFRRAFHMMGRGGPFMKDSDLDPEMFHTLEHQLERLMRPREYRPEPKPEPAPEPAEKPPLRSVGRGKRKPGSSNS